MRTTSRGMLRRDTAAAAAACAARRSVFARSLTRPHGIRSSWKSEARDERTVFAHRGVSIPSHEPSAEQRERVWIDSAPDVTVAATIDRTSTRALREVAGPPKQLCNSDRLQTNRVEHADQRSQLGGVQLRNARSDGSPERPYVAFFDYVEQRDQLARKSIRYAPENLQGWVLLASLDAAKVRRVDLRQRGERFDRPLAALAHRADALAHRGGNRLLGHEGTLPWLGQRLNSPYTSPVALIAVFRQYVDSRGEARARRL